MRIPISKPTLFITIGIVALLVTGGAIAANRDTLPGNPPTSSSKQSTKTGTSSVAAESTASANNSSSSTKPGQAGSTNPATSPTPACKAFTLAMAEQALGANTKAATPSNTAALKTADSTVSSCAYSGANGTAQLTIRTAKDSLGASENATVFGSEKPSGAVNLSGYGQSAYWDPAKPQLNFLSSNDWYIITRSTGSQADAEAIAKQLVPGL